MHVKIHKFPVQCYLWERVGGPHLMGNFLRFDDTQPFQRSYVWWGPAALFHKLHYATTYTIEKILHHPYNFFPLVNGVDPCHLSPVWTYPRVVHGPRDSAASHGLLSCGIPKPVPVAMLNAVVLTHAVVQNLLDWQLDVIDTPVHDVSWLDPLVSVFEMALHVDVIRNFPIPDQIKTMKM